MCALEAQDWHREGACAVNHGVHQDILPKREALHFIPAENFVFRKSIAIGHDLFVLLPDLVIDEVCNEKVDAVSGKGNVSDLFQYIQKDLGIQPVIGVYDLEIKTARIF